MSNKKNETKPAALKPAISDKALALAATYTHPNGAIVHYHDSGNAFNAQRRYVGGANEPLAAAAAKAVEPKDAKPSAVEPAATEAPAPAAEPAPAEQPAATPAQPTNSQPGKGR